MGLENRSSDLLEPGFKRCGDVPIGAPFFRQRLQCFTSCCWSVSSRAIWNGKNLFPWAAGYVSCIAFKIYTQDLCILTVVQKWMLNMLPHYSRVGCDHWSTSYGLRLKEQSGVSSFATDFLSTCLMCSHISMHLPLLYSIKSNMKCLLSIEMLCFIWAEKST